MLALFFPQLSCSHERACVRWLCNLLFGGGKIPYLANETRSKHSFTQSVRRVGWVAPLNFRWILD